MKNIFHILLAQHSYYGLLTNVWSFHFHFHDPYGIVDYDQNFLTHNQKSSVK